MWSLAWFCITQICIQNSHKWKDVWKPCNIWNPLYIRKIVYQNARMDSDLSVCIAYKRFNCWCFVLHCQKYRKKYGYCTDTSNAQAPDYLHQAHRHWFIARQREQHCTGTLCKTLFWNSAVLLLRFLPKIRSVVILDTIVCSGTLLWLFSPAWDAVKLTPQVGFICPLVVIDPTNLDATFVVALALCLTILSLSATQKTFPFYLW